MANASTTSLWEELVELILKQVDKRRLLTTEAEIEIAKYDRSRLDI